MSDSVPEYRSKPQPVGSGGPPKPPKKTARGLEDEPPPDNNELARLAIKVFHKMLANPNTSATDRSRCKQMIEKFTEDIRKRGGKP
jgi:hypothetical protein